MLQKEAEKQTNVVQEAVRQVWQQVEGMMEKARNGASKLCWEWGLLLFAAGVLLGRAAILTELYPFALPFFAVVFALKRERTILAALAVSIGAYWGMVTELPFLLFSMLAFIVLYTWLRRLGMQLIVALPVSVFTAAVGSRLAVYYVSYGNFTSYDWVMTGVEASLALMLTMIFLHSLPLLTDQKQRPLTNEEIICFIILLASILTGAIGWVMYGLAAEHVLARYLVLLFAFAGGAAIGSTVGVVTGLVLSLAAMANLYQMSLLAFAGLLGGLLKDGRKIGVSFGLLAGTMLIALYGEGMYAPEVTMMESAAAVALFLLTPKAVNGYISQYIPGTESYAKYQKQYVDRVRGVTASRVEQFSRLFHTLASSFSSSIVQENKDADDTDRFLSEVTARTCQSCFRKETCWVDEFDKTYDCLSSLKQGLETNGEVSPQGRGRLRKFCYYPERVSDVLTEEWGKWQLEYRLNKQVEESRRLVADQLNGVSQVMDDFAKEIEQEKEHHYKQEEEIERTLAHAGLPVRDMDIYSLTPRCVDIEMEVGAQTGHGEAEKLIAPMLSDILRDHIIVEQQKPRGMDGYQRVRFGSARSYKVESGVAHVAKGGAWVSGDNHSAMEVGSGKFAVAISDGMGNGRRAHEESRATLELLQNILQSGMDENVAIKSINSVLSLRTTEEMFSTLDLAMVDLQTAETVFVKVGSMPAYIKRGDKVLKIEASNLPMGMLDDMNVDMLHRNLQDGDVIVLMSDGLLDNAVHIENREVWMKRMIRDVVPADPQHMADLLLEKVVRASDGNIQDDMTVAVAEVKRNMPEWQPIPVLKRNA
ncbi:stage II sporulation protein E [Salsuginibacillus halophilus]|uniref:Stage II sporulation protein E n=1 Tax=Salsuginibacillus halophilus TaxID=517424 RepID=A0A2P8H7S1_9BACI|nr:stage II sporulation protein E [Salsuginibacillus halophilus]PSL42266.1 stage II sporulation protein E [Salsuginibacillus halophilus]